MQTDKHSQFSQKAPYFISVPQQDLITKIVLYISHTYPQSKQLLIKFAHFCICHHSNYLINVLQHLSKCLVSEFVYGPSHGNIAVSQLPKLIYKDMHFEIHKCKDEVSLKQLFIKCKFDTLINPNRADQFNWYEIKKYLSIAAKQKSKKEIVKQLSLEGQSWIQSIPLASIFLVVRKLYTLIGQHKKFQHQFHMIIWRARLSFLHNRILNNPVKQLAEQTLNGYRNALHILKTRPIEKCKYVQLLLQYNYALLFYYKYNAAEKAISLCLKIANFKIQYTGVLGRRTKYQSFDTAQLIMNVKTNEQNKDKVQQKQEQQIQQPYQQKVDFPKTSELILKQTTLQDHNFKKITIDNIKYDQQSILVDIPAWLEQSQLEQMSIERCLIVTATINYMWLTIPHDELLYQHISTSINTLLTQKILQYSYPIKFSLLLLRSLNQFPRVKNVQRAFQQLQRLNDQYNQQSFKNHDIFATPYEPHLCYVKMHADKLIECGMIMSAVQLFQKVGMYEQCIDGLIKRNYKERALEMANKLLKEKGQTPRLLCMIGDTQKEGIQYYERAWKLSEQRYPRAQKSLGWTYFILKKYQLAAESFHKCLAISYYQPNTWFTLGCTYMQIKQYQKALKAFGESISIDDTQGQAWGNMGSCYLSLNKIKEAYTTLDKAVKHSSGNWKLWSNLLSVSLRVKQFYKYFECIEKIVMLDHHEVLTNQVFKKISTIFQYKLNQSARKMTVHLFQKRIFLLYSNIAAKMSQLPIYWHHFGQFYCVLFKHFLTVNDPTDFIPGYETEQKTKLSTFNNIKQTKKRYVEIKQTQLNMDMAVGWEQNKIIGKRVLNTFLQYIGIYDKYSEKEDLNDYNLFVSGVRMKLQHCLEDSFANLLKNKTQ